MNKGVKVILLLTVSIVGICLVFLSVGWVVGMIEQVESLQKELALCENRIERLQEEKQAHGVMHHELNGSYFILPNLQLHRFGGRETIEAVDDLP